MSLRRKGRELALQILYQWDIHRDTSGWLEDFWAQNPTHSEAKTFAEGLVDGVVTHAAELDSLLGRYAEHWTVHRMAITDRTVLRIAVYELLYVPDIPARVTLNEAIEIVDRKSTRLNSSHANISYAVFCLKKKKKQKKNKKIKTIL